MIYNNIYELIGNTPVIKLDKLTGKNDAEVYLKLEWFNPGGSVKDRIAISMIEAAEKEGLLQQGDTIIEPTSGNTGIGLAMVAASKGYKIILTMPESLSIERRKILKGYGAELILTTSMDDAIIIAKELSLKHGYFMPMQFKNINNPLAHMKNTALEIIKDLPDLDYFVASVGTGGTITGVGKILKEYNPNISIKAIEPKTSSVLSGNEAGKHKIQGIGAGFIPTNLHTDILDGAIQVSKDDAFSYAQRAAKEEGILLGISSGASLAAVAKKIKDIPADATVLTFCYDTGERYLSIEGLFE